MRVLIVEDEPKVAEVLTKGFQDAGYIASSVGNGDEGLDLALREPLDLMVVDVMLPGRDGFSIVEALRARQSQVPVVFLSAKRSTEDRIEGLQRGGDDYIVKPFSMSEVLVRAQTILRRTSQKSESETLHYQDLEMNLRTRHVQRGKSKIELHTKEFVLLELMMRNQGRVLNKSQILGHVWKYDFDPQTNVVDVLVCRLRGKVDREFETKLIHTVRGVGYVLRA